jgi:small subunit ribosomal protein S6
VNAYELILILDPKSGEEKNGQVVGKVEEKIKLLGGAIDKIEKWGSRNLASTIRKAKGLTQGYYVMIVFNSAPSLPAELRAFLKVSENVVRYFISRAEVFAPAPVESKEIAGSPLTPVATEEIKGVPLGEPK